MNTQPKRFGQNRKVRLIINGVHIITRVSNIRAGIGDSYQTNAASQKALDALEAYNSNRKCYGISGVWESMNVQVDML